MLPFPPKKYILVKQLNLIIFTFYKIKNLSYLINNILDRQHINKYDILL